MILAGMLCSVKDHWKIFMKWSHAALREMRICPLGNNPEDGLCWPESSH